jgi:hypothetical protein
LEKDLQGDRLKISSRILQIVPRAPGPHEGVGDYALKLAERLHSDHELKTVFAAAAPSFSSRVGNFAVVAPLVALTQSACANCHGIILHYVNYGYHARGVPLRLPLFLRHLKQTGGGRLLTIFHELYASAPPWRSAFWLQPWQKAIAREIAHISDACIVSSEIMRDMLLRLEPAASVSVHPVISTIGEPTVSSAQFVRRDPHRWVVFGGTHLVERSLKSFFRRFVAIPESFSPREMFVLGGNENKAVRDTLTNMPSIKSHYHPAIDAGAASEILSSSSFSWIDYFHHPKVPAAVILKSGSFASYCAHGVIPVFPQAGSQIAVAADPLPGPYYVTRGRVNLPAKSEREKISSDIYNWYGRHAASENLARRIVAALQLEQT